MPAQTLPQPVRIVRYSYDGLQRLTTAVESASNTFAYRYDLAGNRTSVQINGGPPTTFGYNATNQITNTGYIYDNAGNLTNDGSAAYSYDALSRLTARGSTTYTYNGDGTLVSQATAGLTTRYAQDLAAPLSQVLQTQVGATRTDYLYGLNRLASLSGSTKTWYAYDALGSVRRTVADTGTPLGVVYYDPWGTPESGTVPTFGFTGEVQDVGAGMVNLRARWYSTARGTFTSVDPFAGFPEQPYSLHQYQYGYSDPVLLSDPSGRCSRTGDDYCFPDSDWGGGGGNGWGDDVDLAGGLLIPPGVATSPKPFGNVPQIGPMTFEPPVPVEGPFVGPVIILVNEKLLKENIEWLQHTCSEVWKNLWGQPQPQPQPQPAPTPIVSTPTPTPCTHSTYDYGKLEQFDPANPARKRARWAKATLCQPLGKGTSFQKGYNGTFIEGRGGAFQDRGHLIAKELGGRGIRENGVPMAPASNQYGSRMRTIEEQVKAAVLQRNDVVRYEVTPLYDDSNGPNPVPPFIHILAVGSSIYYNESIPNRP